MSNSMNNGMNVRERVESAHSMYLKKRTERRRAQFLQMIFPVQVPVAYLRKCGWGELGIQAALAFKSEGAK